MVCRGWDRQEHGLSLIEPLSHLRPPAVLPADCDSPGLRLIVLVDVDDGLALDPSHGFGRDRKHASIGVYDLDKLREGRFVYRTAEPEELIGKIEELNRLGNR